MDLSNYALGVDVWEGSLDIEEPTLQQAGVTGSGGSAGTYAESYVSQKFQIVGSMCSVRVAKQITNKGSWSGNVMIARPVTGVGTGLFFGGGWIFANGGTANAPKAMLLGQIAAGATVFFFTNAAAVSNYQWSSVVVNDWITVETTYEI